MERKIDFEQALMAKVRYLMAGLQTRVQAAWLLGLLCGLLFIMPRNGVAEVPAQAACMEPIVSVMAARSSNGLRPEQGWEAVSLPDVWESRWPGYSGTVWYRIDWQRQCPESALLLDSIVMAGEIYANDDLIFRDTNLVEPLSRSWAVPRYAILPGATLHEGLNTIWVRVVGVARSNSGLGVLRLGAPEQLRPLYDRYFWQGRGLMLVNMVVSVVLGCIAFGIWLAWRRQSLWGWYALTECWWVLLCYGVVTTETWPFPDTTTLMRVVQLVYVFYVVSFCLFTWHLLGLRHSERVQQGLAVMTALLAAVCLLAPDMAGLHMVGSVAGVLLLGNYAYVIAMAFRPGHRNGEHILIAVCFFIICLVAVRDALVMLGVIPSRLFFFPYTCVIFLALAAVVMGRRTMRSARRIEHFNQELGEAVEKACTDLSLTLEKEHELALSNSRLQERLQLVHDLHDGLGGQIARSILQVEGSGKPMDQGRFLSMLKLLRDDLRQLIDNDAGTQTSTPDTPGRWAAALRHRFGNLFDERDVALAWHLPPAWETMPGALQCLLLARIVEEALTNVAKHSRARRADVRLAYQADGRLSLQIADDGVGFNVGESLHGGLGIGLGSMRARVERLRGVLDIQSGPSGTVVKVLLPVA